MCALTRQLLFRCLVPRRSRSDATGRQGARLCIICEVLDEEGNSYLDKVGVPASHF